MSEAGCAFCTVVAAVGHLHWHRFPRYEWDPNPKGPIWEIGRAPSELQSRSDLVCRLLLEKKNDTLHISSGTNSPYSFNIGFYLRSCAVIILSGSSYRISCMSSPRLHFLLSLFLDITYHHR